MQLLQTQNHGLQILRSCRTGVTDVQARAVTAVVVAVTDTGCS